VFGSHALLPRWPPQCSCVVIKSSFDPGERLQAPGSLWFHQIFKILIVFVLYFKNYKRQVVSWNCKHVQNVKIYLACNFEVNPITHFDRLCKLEKRGMKFKKKSSPQKPLGQLQPNFCGMILGWPQHAHRFFHLGVHVPFTFIFGGTSTFLGVQCTL
jgi:hypothetical protein